MIRTWQVGDRTCTMTVPRPAPGSLAHVAMEWTPDMPEGLSADEWQQYRRGRDAAIAEVAAALQIAVAVVDL
ncbi:hypothetical protein [Methylibium petroleiphilum]|uniref:hypothetical protein n=1 Tax=Methylibium petroleiphilum TaxID=105560 RepID=UPI003D28B8A8